jgi:hypothetical protein
MTAAEIYESVTNGGASDFAEVVATRRLSKRKKDELDLIRIAEAYPELRRLIPAEIVKQL